MKIRIAGTEFSIKNHSYEIYIQGCTRNCAGCHNPETHSFTGGKEYEIEEFFCQLHKRLAPFIDTGLIKKIFISGGDLLCSPMVAGIEFSSFLTKYFPYLEAWLFTGATPEELPDWVWDDYNIVKCGTYREDLRNPEGTFPASSNQVLLFRWDTPQNIIDSTEFQGEKRLWKKK